MILNAKGSNPNGRKYEIRSTDSIDYRKDETGYSLFTWIDTDKTGVICWREHHGMAWEPAYKLATDWIK